MRRQAELMGGYCNSPSKRKYAQTQRETSSYREVTESLCHQARLVKEFGERIR